MLTVAMTWVLTRLEMEKKCLLIILRVALLKAKSVAVTVQAFSFGLAFAWTRHSLCLLVFFPECSSSSHF
jgi:hypothetical protein